MDIDALAWWGYFGTVLRWEALSFMYISIYQSEKGHRASDEGKYYREMIHEH